MRILIGLVVLALALPASAGLVNGDFEAGLNGWTCTNVMNDPSTNLPTPRNLDGDHRAGDSNCNSRTSVGSQTAMCLDPIDGPDCQLTGGLAGGGPSPSYWVKLTGPCGTVQIDFPGGIYNWQVFADAAVGGVEPTYPAMVLPTCCGSELTVEFGEVGNGAWGAAGFHIDALVLECVPEPGTGLSLFLLAGLPLLRRRR